MGQANKKREEAGAIRKASRKTPKISTKPDRTHPYYSGNRSKCVQQAQVTDAIGNLVVQQMLPLSIVESPSFVDLVTTLTQGNPIEIKVPGRKALTSHNENKFREMKEHIKQDFARVKYVCTTADIWTKRKKSYLGMTGHLLDPVTLERRGYALACRRMTMSHTYEKIAEQIHSIHKEYGVVGKVEHTVTDNAANFCKAFRELPEPEDTATPCTENEHEGIEEETPDSVHEDDEVKFEEFDIGRYVEDDDDGVVTLPKQLRCNPHTLNLVASTDIVLPAKNDKIPPHKMKIANIIRYKEMKEAVFEQKLNKLWMRLSKSTLASDQSQEICGTTFPVPIYTRWNSEIRCVKKIITTKVTDLNTLLEKLNLPKMKAAEFDFLVEWETVMNPLALAIDKLQGETDCFMGTIVPTIRATWLQIKKEEVAVCQPLKEMILQSFEKRDEKFIGESILTSETEPFIMAAIAIPCFKVKWIPETDRPRAIELFIKECSKIRSEVTIPTETAVQSDEFFSVLGLTNEGTSSEKTDVESSIKIQVLRYLDDKRKTKLILKEYPAVNEVFLRLNTTLPSSAPVERLFCDGGRILTPDRNRLSDRNFEMSLLLKSFKACKKYVN